MYLFSVILHDDNEKTNEKIMFWWCYKTNVEIKEGKIYLKKKWINKK